ncbi:hypothetical protein [Streptomyces katrae]|uniref:hypothetical protein n=1 Tax=Streptomyces katrae TaxID=68223 RepID=UPI0004BF2CE9|nr:hypothetical protein [Streptomyces katrae]
MARKQNDLTRRRAREAARRAAAAERIGPRPKRTPRPRNTATLYSLNPPGAFYQEWASPALPHGTDATSPLEAVVAQFGPDSGQADTMRTLLKYGDLYGTPIPVVAARHLERLARLSGLAADAADNQGITEDEAIESLHSLHAEGLLLVDDDGSVWMTVPPGTPYSAPDGVWAFMEKRLEAPKGAVAALNDR